MFATKPSSKGQVTLPKRLRTAQRWAAGLEFTVIDIGDGVPLKPRSAFARTQLAEVAGMLKTKVKPKTTTAIQAALRQSPIAGLPGA